MSLRLHRLKRMTVAGGAAAFTLLEMVLAMTVVVLALMVVVQAMARVQDTWKMTHSKVRQAQDARAGMETMSRTIVSATLNGRWEIADADDPKYLRRQSDLHFVCGPASVLLKKSDVMTGHSIFFQAPYGYSGPVDSESSTTTTSTTEKTEYETLPDVLNAWGYFVEFGPDPVKLPPFITGDRRAAGLAPKRYRFRLMEFRQPAHELALFQMDTSDPPKSKLSQINVQTELYEWFNKPVAETNESGRRRTAVIAENVLGFIIQPLQDYEAVDSTSTGSPALPLGQDTATDYVHDSRRHQWEPASTRAFTARHRLPASLKITMIVLDEKDWDKLTDEQAQQTGTELRSLVVSRFSKPASFAADLGAVTGELNRRRMKHREITTVLRMPGSRWTTDREN